MSPFETTRSHPTEDPITVREIDSLADLACAVQLYNEVFEPDEGLGSTVTVEFLKVLSKSGNYVGAAFIDNDMVGMSAGMFGEPAAASFHSHVTAIRSSSRGKNVGRVLKKAQAEWVRARGVSTITWTFDPLVRRNAHFNLRVLGARVTQYLENFYGPIEDKVNGGDDSDRLMVAWNGEFADPIGLSSGGEVPVILHQTVHGAPASVASGARLVLIQVPADIEAIRLTDPELAQSWRYAVRRALIAELGAGARVVGFTEGGYMLERGRLR